MSPEIKERWEEHRYALVLNNFLLSLYQIAGAMASVTYNKVATLSQK